MAADFVYRHGGISGVQRLVERVMLKLEELTDTELLALLIAAEADDQPIAGQVSVACVVTERLRRQRWGNNLRSVILAPYQFSTFNGTHWQAFTPRISRYIMMAQLAVDDLLKTLTPTATHYHATSITPAWASSKQMVRLGTIGQHAFYREL